jgi:hypothetical protein
MKISITSIRNSLLLSLLIMPYLAQAKLVGKIHGVKGHAFMNYDGRTVTLKKDMDVYDSAQIIVSDDAQVTVGDFYDRYYHLAAGTSFVMHHRAGILQKGQLWSQTAHASRDVSIATANLLMQSFRGEFIVTYSVVDKCSQLTVISGEVNVASPKQPNLRYAISAGEFTIAHPDQDNGYPRAPTRLGYESLQTALAQFPGVTALDHGIAQVQKQSGARSIASVEETPAAPARTQVGSITYIKTVTPARNVASAQEYYLKKVKAPRKPKAVMGAPVRVIGADWKAVTSAPTMKLTAPMVKRDVASVKKGGVPAPGVLEPNLSEFLKSYEFHQSKQHQHTPEVQRLIDDLKSY